MSDIRPPLTPSQLADLKAKAKAATPGPWSAEGKTVYALNKAGGRTGAVFVAAGKYRKPDEQIANADLVGTANPETILRLIDMGERRDAWRPIETAPKDGTPVLVAGGTLHFHDDSTFPYEGDAKAVSIACWQKAHGCFEGWMGEALEGHDNYIEHRPTVWQPLPAPPSEALAATEPVNDKG